MAPSGSEEEGTNRDKEDKEDIDQWVRVALQVHLEKLGMKASDEVQKKELSRFTREELFKMIKFPQWEHLSVRKKPAKKVMECMGYDRKNSSHVAAFEAIWEKWMQNHVKGIINEKRSSISQSIGKHLTNDVWLDASSPVKPDYESYEALFENLREEKDTYGWFFDNVVSFVIGRSQWKHKWGSELLEEYCNVGDEALGLLLLENSWDCWSKRAISGQQKWSSRKGGQRKKQDDSANKKVEARPMYTVSLHKEQKTEIQGWTKEGLERFNELRKEVESDRDKHGKEFSTWYKNKHTAENEKKRKRNELQSEHVT